ncbi:F-box/LRR-repeat protein [Cardamine amara subsp. amara]|uniref:F-box/LRR-repeat protein n=1 Tax=Cardamine amara subsp. amara TaxID=228776 RepID=A0ABD0Z4V4_CARAN
MSHDQILRVRYAQDVEADPDGEMIIGNVTNFIMGICNVKILYLSDDTLQVLNYCCETVPVFDNLVHLTIKTHEDVGWTSLPSLLKNCPILETLIFEGLHHKCMNRCGDRDGCICKDFDEDEDEEEQDIPSCLSSSPVKMLKILFGDDERGR